MTAIIDNQPSSHPQNPQASVFAQLLREIEVAEISQQQSYDIADKIFSYLNDIKSKLTHDEFLAGKIPPSNQDEELDRYIKIMNGLIKIAYDDESGTFKTLSTQLIAEYDKIPADPKDLQAMTLAKVYGGSELLKTLCVIVSSEIPSHILPRNDVSQANAKPIVGREHNKQ